MAGYWIKFETSTSDKPEVWLIADRLGIDPDAVVGKLLRIWAWFDDHTEKGNAPSVTKALLDRRVGVTGFCDAMLEAGWMLEEDGSVLLPHFNRHNGKTAKSRVLTAKRVASHKKSNADGNAKGNARSVTSALPRREEKRRDNTHTHTQAETPEIELLKDQDFAAVWLKWEQHRREKMRPLGQIESEAQLLELSRHDPLDAKAMIEFSIRQGASNLITNGDHKPQPARTSAASLKDDFIPRD